jgi:hypothetical protein
MRTKRIVFGLLKIKVGNYMKHYIIVKFKEDYNYLKQLEGYTGGEKYIDLNILNKEKQLEDLIVN